MLRVSARGATWVAGLIALVVFPGCEASTPSEHAAPFQQATNLGAAHLENKDAAGAIAAFEQAVALAPESAAAHRNLARAALLARDDARLDAALDRARSIEPDSAATAYLSGIALARASQFEEAIPHLESATRFDPTTAAIRFQLALAYQSAGRDDDARTQLEETIRLDPLHVAAHYRLAGQARRSGDEAALQRLQIEITRLREVLGDEAQSPDALEVCIHTRPERPRPPPGDAAPPPEIRFSESPERTADLANVRTAAVLELDDAGRYRLVAIDAGGAIGVFGTDDAGRFARASKGPVLPDAVLDRAPLRLVVGNFHDTVPDGERYDATRHARNDALAVSPGGVVLLERDAQGGFIDVTERAGLAGVSGRAARWLDYDHDGDLDLAVGGREGVALWQNGGDGRFDDVTASVGLDSRKAVFDLVGVDLASDGATDLVVAGGAAPTVVYEGQRTGRFARQVEPPGPWPIAERVLVDDLDGDGDADALLVGDRIVQIVSASGGAPSVLDLASFDPSDAALIDVDGDGRLDVVIAGRGPDEGHVTLRLWHNDGRGGFQPVDGDTGLGGFAFGDVSALQSADLDADGDADLLLATGDSVRVLRNDTEPGGGLLRLRLQGMKTNPSGYGVRVTIRGPGLRVTRFVQDVPIELGLDGRSELDALQTLWTNGVVDNQIAIELDVRPRTVVEQNVAAGSCPYLYVWDGTGFRFVTDLLGNAPIGLSQRRGVPLAADPDEIVWIGGADTLTERDGAYVLQVTDELREVVYLDHARLIAVDHPGDVEVHPTDRLMEPPFPPSEVWALGSPRVPRSAIGDDGIDRTDAVVALDDRFAAPGVPLPPPLRGKTRELILDLDFGPLDDVDHPVLALTGWLQYGDASRNIALSQNRSVAVVPPTLEQQTASGEWKAVDVVVGMPAGKTKTILVDLRGKLVPGARRLRLRTTFELRWDRIALLSRLPDDAIRSRVLEPSGAALSERGFSSIRARRPGHPTTPRHEDLQGAPPWETTPSGFVTRLGDVLTLMASRDDQLVVMNGGDALELSFDATLPEPEEGRRRTFFFYSVGWDKDEDHNVIDGTTVEPLPVSETAAAVQRTQWHTRFVPRDAPARWSTTR